ncbi:DUF2283 domain-containing protein [uncultured Devosia sp.]|uniref:DUF2283 domain-containing protein n=1 Tax=uncultured Devosia sp. TaxID=211434 RepID=UPI002602D1C5|nr:DUF2283 domain-containing protein [uncultured Devosia sp.]
MTKPTVKYDPDADAAYIRFSAGAVEESEEVSPGIVLDFDKDGHIVGMEVLQARKQLPPDMLEQAA